ncbi:MAG: Gfo/Idh/MocA family oxidoreductase [Pseudomonadota bacterium]
MAEAIAPPVKIGIVSLAMYHGNFWSQAIQASEQADFIGIWDDDPERGEAGALAYGTRYISELGILLASCDAVCITSETHRHAEFVEQAAAAGCHVLCEKPLATSIADCERIIAAVERSGITFMQSYPKRFDPVNAELKRLIDSGELGTITLMRVRHGHLYGLLRSSPPVWKRDPATSGGGALLDEGSHGADLIRWLLGEPDAVMAAVSNLALAHSVEDLGVAVFLYDNGPICELAASGTFAAGDNSVEIFGTKGTAVLSGVDLASRDVTQGSFLKVCRLTEENLTDPTTRQWEVSSMTPGFQSTPEFHQQNPLQFIKALVNGEPAPVSVRDGLRSLQMIVSAYEAARTGTTVRIPPAR